ncbi:CPBP family intramembrane glutamic endopeptidase [Streptococcus dentasini]
MLLVSQIISSLLQVLGVFVISYLIYRLLGKPQNSFKVWLGIEKVQMHWGYIFSIAVIYLFLFIAPFVWLYTNHSITTRNLMTASYQATGFSVETVLIILLWAIIQTSLSEEILFRACLRKLFARLWGQRAGNVLQAFLFALLHIFALITYGFLPVLIIFSMTFSVAYAMGWLVSKNPNGSILESWCIHALVNLISQSFILYFLV